jgi:hypothetical protein
MVWLLTLDDLHQNIIEVFSSGRHCYRHLAPAPQEAAVIGGLGAGTVIALSQHDKVLDAIKRFKHPNEARGTKTPNRTNPELTCGQGSFQTFSDGERIGRRIELDGGSYDRAEYHALSPRPQVWLIDANAVDSDNHIAGTFAISRNQTSCAAAIRAPWASGMEAQHGSA